MGDSDDDGGDYKRRDKFRSERRGFDGDREGGGRREWGGGGGGREFGRTGDVQGSYVKIGS